MSGLSDQQLADFTAADIGPLNLKQLIAFLKKRKIALHGKIPIGNASKTKVEPFRPNNSI